MQDLKPGDKITVSVFLGKKADENKRKGRVTRRYTVEEVFPKFVMLNNGKYRERFDKNEFDSGDMIVQKIERKGQAV